MAFRKITSSNAGITPFTDLETAFEEMKFLACHRLNAERYVVAEGVGGKFFVLSSEDAAGLPILFTESDKFLKFESLQDALESIPSCTNTPGSRNYCVATSPSGVIRVLTPDDARERKLRPTSIRRETKAVMAGD